MTSIDCQVGYIVGSSRANNAMVPIGHEMPHFVSPTVDAVDVTTAGRGPTAHRQPLGRQRSAAVRGLPPMRRRMEPGSFHVSRGMCCALLLNAEL